VIEVKDLALTVQKQVPGELVTNARAIKAFVEERVKEYTPEKYYDDPEAAKKDRAVLNAASKELNTKRLALEREFMRPFEEFKSVIKETTSTIDFASSRLDEIVKAVEETQENEKRRAIKDLFESRAFTLVSLDKIFDSRWLNKGFKIKEIDEEISRKIAAIYQDLAIIDSLPADVDEVKAHYLDNLDIGTALAVASRLKANREAIKLEEETRETRVHEQKIKQQEMDLIKDALIERSSEVLSSMVDDALGIKSDPVIEYTLRFKGTRAQLVSLRSYMNDQGIEYEKVEV